MRFPRLAIVIGAALLMASCSSDDGGGTLFGTDATGSTVTTTATTSSGPGTNATSTTSGTTDTTTAPATTTTSIAAPEPAAPLPIREGLNTFDNYVWRMEFQTVGPTAEETSESTVEWAFNRDSKSRRTTMTTKTTGPDIEGVEETTSEISVVDGETCQWDGESWTHTVATDQQQEALEAVQRLFDVVLVPEDPVFVEPDTVAGTPPAHYRFVVSGFGAESGALVTANQVNYWLADGTGVVLRYRMVLESRSGPTTDPTAEVYRVEASARLISANEPVPIRLHPDCLAIPPEQP
jgi:plastocyanin